MERKIYEIAAEIQADFKKSNDWRNKYCYAIPYLAAMKELSTIDDNYLYDSADSVIRYFLSNVSNWRGETARRIKKELKDMVGLK